jgi:hypothetical protein
MGELFAKKVLEEIPDYEKIVDSYLANFISSDREYNGIIARLAPFKLNLESIYKDEIEGFASKMSGGLRNIKGDGKLSLDELYLANFITDALRPTACSGVAVYGNRSITGKSLIGRVLDWNNGDENQFSKINAVIIYKNNKKSIASVGVLGHFGIISGINDDKIFAAILDSPTKAKYSNKNKRSYSFDIRYALENYDNMEKISRYLLDLKKEYSFNHLIFLGSSKEVFVLENNISGRGVDMKRAIRKSNSKLNNNVSWGIKNAIAVVNSFVLKGNHDNHTVSPHNKKRWNSYKSGLLKLANKKVAMDDIKTILVNKKGEIYNEGTRQIMLFDTENLLLKVFFSQGNMETPTFRDIKLEF